MAELSREHLLDYWALYSSRAVDMSLAYIPRLVLALVVLIVGMWLINRVIKLMDLALIRAELDSSLASFLHSLAALSLKVLLLISVASMVGIATTSFVAVLGAAGLAIGLALQGSLANFAGGVLILLFKPFRVGDYIEAQGVSGSVQKIEIFSTLIHTPDNKVIIVPNGHLSNDIITNYSRASTRRADFVFGIGYDDDIELAKRLIRELITADPRIHNDPEPLIAVAELAPSSVNLTVRVWVESTDLSSVRYALLEQVKLSFDANQISIPYPQQEVHITQAS